MGLQHVLTAVQLMLTDNLHLLITILQMKKRKLHLQIVRQHVLNPKHHVKN